MGVWHVDKLECAIQKYETQFFVCFYLVGVWHVVKLQCAIHNCVFLVVFLPGGCLARSQTPVCSTKPLSCVFHPKQSPINLTHLAAGYPSCKPFVNTLNCKPSCKPLYLEGIWHIVKLQCAVRGLQHRPRLIVLWDHQQLHKHKHTSKWKEGLTFFRDHQQLHKHTQANKKRVCHFSQVSSTAAQTHKQTKGGFTNFLKRHQRCALHRKNAQCGALSLIIVSLYHLFPSSSLLLGPLIIARALLSTIQGVLRHQHCQVGSFSSRHVRSGFSLPNVVFSFLSFPWCHS